MHYVLPVEPFVVVSKFGPRPKPNGPRHPGLDLRGVIGTPVRAVASGKVLESRLSQNDPPTWRWGMEKPADWPADVRWPRVMGYGNLIKISHDNGSISVYAHLASRRVKVGDQVAAGQVIGEVGSTGYSSGPHLHFELWPDGRHVADPLPLLTAVAATEEEPPCVA